ERQQLQVADERLQIHVGLDAHLAAEQDAMDAADEVLQRQAVRLEVEHVLRQLPPLLLRLAEQQQRVLGRRPVRGEALDDRAVRAPYQLGGRDDDPQAEMIRI